MLAQAGVTTSYNSTQFLLRIETGRLALTAGTLFVIDEGSTMPMEDLAKIIDLGEKHDCKLFITGDHQQFAAVEAGGGMAMLANYLGYMQLAVPVRFAAEWERDASLRLRTGTRRPSRSMPSTAGSPAVTGSRRWPRLGRRTWLGAWQARTPC